MRRGMPARRYLSMLVAFAVALAAPSAAQATISSALGVPCTAQADGVRFCGSSSPRSTAPAWDGAPIDVNVAFPAAPAKGPTAPTRWSCSSTATAARSSASPTCSLARPRLRHLLDDRPRLPRVVRLTASRAAAGGACDNGYIRLIDNRYEVRDAQEFAGQLADDGLVSPPASARSAAPTAAACRWRWARCKTARCCPTTRSSPGAAPTARRCASPRPPPNIPWTDLAYSLRRTAARSTTSPTPRTGAGSGSRSSRSSTASTCRRPARRRASTRPPAPTRAPTWSAGGPSRGRRALRRRVQAILDEITTHHSSYYIDHSIAPAPMLISNGFTDDLFPADEAIRYYNRTKTQYPDADLALFFGDFGHPARPEQDRRHGRPERAESTPGSTTTSRASGPRPPQGVEAYTRDLPEHGAFGRPVHGARNWARIAPGEVRFAAPPPKTIAPTSTDGRRVQPGIGTAPAPTRAGDRPGRAPRLPARPPRPAGGYTLLGSPTVIADFTLPGDTSQVAARLLDVAPDGPRRWSRAASGARRRAAPPGRSSSSTPTAGRSRPATCPSSSCSPPTADGGLAELRSGFQRPAAGHGREAGAAPAGRRAPGAAGGLVTSRRPSSSRRGYGSPRTSRRGTATGRTGTGTGGGATPSCQDGISAVIRVPPWGGLSTSRRPLSASTRAASPRRPEPRAARRRRRRRRRP